MKVLLLRFSSIGDIVLTTQLVRCLATQTESEIHFATKPAFKDLLLSNPYISKIHLLNKGLSGLIRELRAENFDLVIDLHHNLRTFLIKRALGKPACSFPKLNVEKWLLVNFKVNRLPSKHIVERYLETVHHLGISDDGKGLELFLPEDAGRILQEMPGHFKPGFIAMAAGAKFGTKQMPFEMMVQIISKLNRPVAVLGGQEDKTTGEKLENAFPEKVWNLCGKISLLQSAEVLKQAQVVITADTGLMHIAAAFDKKIISVWGNTVPEFGMTPLLPANGNGKSVLFEVKGLSCRPCSKIGFAACPKGHFDCMKKQDVEAVVALANQWSEIP